MAYPRKYSDGEHIPFVPQDSFSPSGTEGHLPFVSGRQHLVAEQFRLMAGRLNANQPAGGVLLITSAVPEDGKTLSAANLSFALAERSRTLLLELDLRRPSLRKLLGLTNYSDGIVPVLRGHATPQSAIAALTGTQLQVALCREPSSDVRSALQSPELANLIAWARKQYHWIILDTPPVVPISDVSEIAPLSDAVIMVARARHTPVPHLRRSIDLLGRRIRYTILNDGQVSMESAYQYMNAYIRAPRT